MNLIYKNVFAFIAFIITLLGAVSVFNTGAPFIAFIIVLLAVVVYPLVFNRINRE